MPTADAVLDVPGVGFASEPLFSLPAGDFLGGVTADGHIVAFCERPDGSIACVWDGVAGEPFDGLGLRDDVPCIFSSEDGAHVAYVAFRADHRFVGRDRAQDPLFDSTSFSVPPVFSRGGIHLAYGAEIDGEVRLVVDGRIVGASLAPIAAVFSPDGERLAFVELSPEGRDREVRIVLDGVGGPWFRGMRNARGAMQFSPDSRRFAYYRIDEEGHAQWILDGVAQRLANDVRSISLGQLLRPVAKLEPPLRACFSPDSRRFAYFADVLEKGVAIIEDDVPGPLFKAVGTPVFSPDSRRLAYVAQTYEKRTTVVVDGMSWPGWPDVDPWEPVFSADGRHLAVMLHRATGGLLRKRHHFALAVDGETLAEEEGDDASAVPTFSPDGERVAWWVRRGDACVMLVNGTAASTDPAAASDPVFSSSGRLIYLAVVPDGKATVLVDGRPGPLADDVAIPRTTMALSLDPITDRASVPFEVSHDGEHVAWAGRFGEEWRPVIDHETGPGFEGLLDWRFSDDGMASWWAQRGPVIHRVTH